MLVISVGHSQFVAASSQMSAEAAHQAELGRDQ